MKNELNCIHFNQQNCLSCAWLEDVYPLQLARKSQELTDLLSPFSSHATFLAPVKSAQVQFRNKAKMVVSGSVERPILGILKNINDPNSAIDLTACPLYPSSFLPIFEVVKCFIGRAGLVPYNVIKRKGELKYILLTQSEYNRALMLRFVLRSEDKLALIKRELHWLLTQLPPQSVVSLNIQPQHAAILEGEKEILLTETQVIEERFNEIPLFICPKGFFQTNPNVAAKLYATAQDWIKHLDIKIVWDLFCGVGGFGLHCAKILQFTHPAINLIGIEISSAAIASATASAKQIGLKNIQFQSLDSAQFALQYPEKSPDLVIVNPPRSGIGKDVARFLNQIQFPYLIYSSCNATSMAKDLTHLDNYVLKKVQLFDMFPHTSHYETLILLVRKQ